jgi:hypothetical protein
MEMETITLEVDREAAQAFRDLEPARRRAFASTVAARLHRKPLSTEELFALMDRIGERARSMGLTEEILQEILNEK